MRLRSGRPAMEALILVATLGGPTMFARIGVMRALNRNVERVFDPSRKDKHWGRRKLARISRVCCILGLVAKARSPRKVNDLSWLWRPVAFGSEQDHDRSTARSHAQITCG